MTKTEHYQLNQWEPTDKLSRTDFNADNAAVDAALAAKAEKSAVSAVETALANYKTANDAAVAKKAEQSALDSTNSTLAALEQSMNSQFAAQSQSTAAGLAALSAALGSNGQNCRILTGSYTGTGTCGSASPTGIETGFRPELLMLVADEDYYFRMRKSDGTYSEQEFTTSGSSSKFKITWEDTAVRWYSTTTPTTAGAESQANTNGTVYYYAVLGYDAAEE